VKRILAVLSVAFVLVALPAAAAAVTDTFTAKLSGSEEVPAVSTSATGTATVNIITDSEVNEINYEVSYSGLSGDVAAAHIHLGAVGENGGIILPLKPGPSPFSGTLKESDVQATGDVANFADAIKAIRDGRTYVNLHTAANPGGEIRGQLKLLLNGATEDPVAPAGPPILLLIAGFAAAAVLAWMRPLARQR